MPLDIKDFVKKFQAKEKKEKAQAERRKGEGKSGGGGGDGEGNLALKGAGAASGGKGKGKAAGAAAGKGKGKGKGKAKGQEPSQEDKEPLYRDRAKERQEGKGEYERVAAEFEQQAEVSVEDSKYLGGDYEHTHLVKGLDFALLSKIRTQLNKHQKADEVRQERQQRKEKKKREFETDMARKVWHAVVETLHPHHSTFEQRCKKMGEAIAMGQRIRGAPSVFLPGRMAYEFDTSQAEAPQRGVMDIPRVVYSSKEDAPEVDTSKRVAGILPETVTRVGDVIKRALDERKQRKKAKTSGGGEAPVAVSSVSAAAAASASKRKAKDFDIDIFPGVETFSSAEVIKKARQEQAAKAAAKAASDPGAKKRHRSSST